MLHHHVFYSSPERTNQTLVLESSCFFMSFAATTGSPTHLEQEVKGRGIQLVAIRNLTTRRHLILHTGPLKFSYFSNAACLYGKNTVNQVLCTFKT